MESRPLKGDTTTSSSTWWYLVQFPVQLNLLIRASYCKRRAGRSVALPDRRPPRVIPRWSSPKKFKARGCPEFVLYEQWELEERKLKEKAKLLRDRKAKVSAENKGEKGRRGQSREKRKEKQKTTVAKTTEWLCIPGWLRGAVVWLAGRRWWAATCRMRANAHCHCHHSP